MSALKALQAEQLGTIQDSLNARGLKQVYRFPSYWGLAISSTYIKKRHQYSFSVGMYSTGGRVHYADYSGEVRLDKVATTVPVGLSYGFTLIDSKYYQIGAGLGLRVHFSRLKTDDLVEIYVSEERDAQANIYHSRELALLPQVAAVVSPVAGLKVTLEVGYSAQLKSSAPSTKNGSSLLDKKNRPVELDWSGYRVGAIVGYRITMKK